MKLSSLFFATMAIFVSATIHSANAVGLEGVWVGSGLATPQNGEPERLRCRVTYNRINSKIYSVVAVCATTATKIRQTGELVKVRPGLFVGDFNNRQYEISGRVRVNQRGKTQSVTFSSDAGRGSLSLRKR